MSEFMSNGAKDIVIDANEFWRVCCIEKYS